MSEREERIHLLALEVLRLARSTLLVNLRFMDAALNQLRLFEVSGLPLATDGEVLAYEPAWVLRRYRQEREAVTRDVLHVVLHGVFHHMFYKGKAPHEAWDLACDIAVESVIAGLGVRAAAAAREQEQKKILAELGEKVPGLTAEKLCRYFVQQGLSSEELEDLRRPFLADDHRPWYLEEEQKEQNEKEGREVFFGLPPELRRSDEAREPGEGEGEGEQRPAEDSGGEAGSPEARWEEISRRMEMELENFIKRRGEEAGSLLQNLREVNRERYDYGSFLRKFAVRGETLRVNDEEFDYVYYTYGLELYGDMPLVEPLEYKEERRIRKVVVAIDTSASVEGPQVQAFLQKTFNILKSTESFFSKINLHIIQCDAQIQEDAKITSQEDFDRYIAHTAIRGLGGTDFRPVFAYVDDLIRQKEFTNLKGLIYFTDGYGTFPAAKPEYDAAFVFVESGQNSFEVPPWAIRLILPKEDL